MKPSDILTLLTDNCTKAVYYELLRTGRRYSVRELLRCSKVKEYNEKQVRGGLINLIRLRAVKKCELTRMIDGREVAVYVAR